MMATIIAVIKGAAIVRGSRIVPTAQKTGG
jgi:hypothetical protein